MRDQYGDLISLEISTPYRVFGGETAPMIGDGWCSYYRRTLTNLLREGEMPEIPKVIRVTVQYGDGTNPASEDGWTVYTFGDNGIISDIDRERFFDDETGNPVDQELAHKLVCGLAFGCEYTSRGGDCMTSLREHSTEDGLVVWEAPEDDLGPLSMEERKEDAEAFLETYTEWQNGRCFDVMVEKITSVAPGYDADKDVNNGAFWESVEGGVGDLIGEEMLNNYIKDSILPDYPCARVVVAGNAAHVVELD